MDGDVDQIEGIICEIVKESQSPKQPLNDSSNSDSKKKVKRTKEEIEKRKIEKEEKQRKWAQILQERQRKKEEEEKRKVERAEREKRKLAEREKLNAQRQEAKVKRDEQKRQKEAEKKQEEEEKLVRKARKDEERKAKEEEKQKQEAEKLAMKQKKDEEKHQLEMAKIRLEEEKKAEEEKKKQFAARFFRKVEKNESKNQCNGYSPSFEIKKDSSLAPICRRSKLFSSDLDAFVILLQNQETQINDLYVARLKCRRHKPHRWRSNTSDVMLADDGVEKGCQRKPRRKYFMFSENRRPPYFGTWRKRCIGLKRGRRPFACAYEEFKYDEDSEDEWEEEPEDGDECKSDDEEENDAEANVDSEDDGYFVDHAYLSSDEIDEDEQEMDADARRERMKCKAEAWKSEKLARKWEKLKPIVVGPIFLVNSSETPSTFVAHLDLLRSMQAICVEESPISVVAPVSPPVVTPANQTPTPAATPKITSKKRVSTNSIEKYCKPKLAKVARTPISPKKINMDEYSPVQPDTAAVITVD